MAKRERVELLLPTAPLAITVIKFAIDITVLLYRSRMLDSPGGLSSKETRLSAVQMMFKVED